MLIPTESEFHFEMGYTVTEFTRVLEGKLTGANSAFTCEKVQQNHWLINLSDVQKSSALAIEIFIRQLQPRKMALIEIPVLQVNFKVLSSIHEQKDIFFDKFFKYFHKGGG